MLDLRWTPLEWNSACAAVARSSDVPPDFVVADRGAGGEGGIAAALWRRTRTSTPRTERLDEHLLSYCVAGHARCSVDADGHRLDYPMRAGSLSLLRAGAPVRWAMRPEDVLEPVVQLHLYLPAARVDRLGGPPRGGAAGAARLRNEVGFTDPWLTGFFQMLLGEVQAGSRGTRLAQSRFLERTADLLIEHLRDERSEAIPPAPRPSSPCGASPLRPSLLRRVQGHVQDHLRAPLRLAGLAALASMSEDHFLRAFRAATGVTPHQFVLQRRLDRARELLQDTNRPIRDIARCCGFAGGTHFATAFRHVHGMTPSEFRRRH